jgi:hypothetical protein
LTGPKPSAPIVAKAKVVVSTVSQSAEDVAGTIFAALKNNNNPEPNHGLKVLRDLLLTIKNQHRLTILFHR